MNKFTEYYNELETDTRLDEFTVKDIQMKLPGIKHKWVGRLIRTKFYILDLKKKRAALIDNLSVQLSEQSPVKLSVATCKEKIKTLPQIVDIDNELDNEYLILEFLEKTEKILSSMTFDIKNIAEIIKIETQ